ncbi:MAG: hypothetical protein R3Y66_04770 [Rikenellaceae bacterium]
MKRFIIYVAIALLSATEVVAEARLTPLSKERIDEVRSMLKSSTSGYGEPITQRERWDELAKSESSAGVIRAAEQVASTPLPTWSDSLMVQYLTTGIRKEADLMCQSRTKVLMPLVVAECLENRGRFIEAIEGAIVELCRQPSWVLVAHDPNLDNFYGREYHVDLGAATTADLLGQTIYMVGEKLNPEVVELLRSRLQERIYNPILKSYRTLDDRGGSKQRWIVRDNNWNLVCLAGVTSSALAVIEDLDLRAEFVAAAEKYIQYGIGGFLEDGYCAEGIGYYNYGFSSLIRLREALYRATDSQIDLFEAPRMQRVATFGVRSEIINNIYPAITDCHPGTTPSEWITWYCNRAFSWEQSIDRDYDSKVWSSIDAIIGNFNNSPCKIKGDATESSKSLRSYFDKADVLSCRPYPSNWDSSLALNIKGGTNNESHNHNDVGSYTIVAGDDIMMGDMGGPIAYTSKTFSAERYTLYPMFSSFGHPVPLIGGVQQYDSPDAVGRTISRKFTNKRDVVLYDISSAYQIEELEELTRLFEYNRKKGGEIRIKDQFKASQAMDFETAITTRQEVTILKDRIVLSSDDNSIEVRIDSSEPFTITTEEVSAYAFEPFTRVAITLNNKAKSGSIELTYINRQ